MSTDASKPRLSTTGSPEDYKPTYGDPKRSSSNDVAFEKEPRHGAVQGILETQAEGPQGNQGHRPAAEEVKTVQPREAGFAKKCADIQLQEQRQDLK